MLVFLAAVTFALELDEDHDEEDEFFAGVGVAVDFHQLFAGVGVDFQFFFQLFGSGVAGVAAVVPFFPPLD